MRTPRWLSAVLAALASTFTVAACGDDDNGGGGGGAIASNSANKKTTIVVGSKNFTEQKVLGEIFAQGLAAAGYTVKKTAQPGRRKGPVQGPQVGQDRRRPRVHGHRARLALRRRLEQDPEELDQGLQRGQGRLRQAGIHGLPADAVHELERGRGHPGNGQEVPPHEHLGP